MGYIGHIVDSCRVWESHSERESNSDASRDQDSLGESDESLNVGCLQTKLKELTACSDMGWRVPVSVVGVETPRKVEKGDGQLAPLEAISLLVAQLLCMTREGQWMDRKAPLEGKLSPLSAVSPGPGTERGHSAKEWVRVFFSCGCQGHGVNRCSQVDTSLFDTGVVGGCSKWLISGDID